MITPRNRKFELSAPLSRDWHSNDPFKTALSNSFSFPLPSGEKLFVNCLRSFLDKLDDSTIIHDSKSFIAQELIHSREHKKYNETLCNLRGYDLDVLEGPYRTFMNFAQKNFAPKQLLAVTVCVEHLTACFAENSILNNKWSDNVDPVMIDFWTWHAYEEIEHRCVAYDVYQYVFGDKEQLHTMMGFVVENLTSRIIKTACKIFEMENRNPSEMKKWLRTSDFLVGDQGIIAPLMHSVNRFFEPTFHPNFALDFNSIQKHHSLLLAKV